MNVEKKEATQEMGLMVKVGGDNDDDADDDDDDEQSNEQQDGRADSSSATAERTMSDEWEQSKEAACTKGAQEEGACECSSLMQPAASDRRFER